MKKRQYCPYCGHRLTQKILDGTRRLYCAHCIEVLYENPVPATCLVVINHAGGVLLVKRNISPKRGFWCLPGGFLELGEKPEDGALRELEEETGLKGEIDRLLGVTASRSEQYDTVLMIGYLIKNFTGVPTPGDDASEAVFFAVDELPDIAFESHAAFIHGYYAADSD